MSLCNVQQPTMDLRTEILREHSRRQALRIVDWIGMDEERFKQLLHLFLHDEYRVVQRSAYPLSIVAERHPALAEKNLHLLVARLYNAGTHVAVRRNVVRILQFVSTPEDLQAAVMDRCFQYLSDTREAIAVRCFSMTVLANLAKQHPEIKLEVEWAIQRTLENPSAGMRARARKVLQELKKTAHLH